jgi:hypothetical protein
MKWIEALRMWNSSQSKWSIPKKGTDDYKEVRALMDGVKPDLKPTKKKTPKKSKAKKADDFEKLEEVTVEFDGMIEKPKRKRGRPKKIVV